MPRTNLVHQAPHRCPAEAHEALLHRQFQLQHPLGVGAGPTHAASAMFSLDMLNELSRQFLVHFVDLPVV